MIQTGFPRSVYGTKDPKTAVPIFRSRRIICTGFKKPWDAATAVDCIVKELEGLARI